MTAEWDARATAREQRATTPAEPPIDSEQLLIEALSRIRDDQAHVAQIARLAHLSLELRLHRYTGQVMLHPGNGLVNSIRQEEWVDWRTGELAEVAAPFAG